MKFWDGEKFRQLTCSCEADALRATGYEVVDDDAPQPEPVAPEPQLAAPAPRRGRKADA